MGIMSVVARLDRDPTVNRLLPLQPQAAPHYGTQSSRITTEIQCESVLGLQTEHMFACLYSYYNNSKHAGIQGDHLA
jgi:hypothetical protein